MRRTAAAVLLLAVAASCGGPHSSSTDAHVYVAAFYPIYEAVKAIAPPGTDVVNLTAPGAEPHDVELTSRQVDQVLDAKVVVYLGGGFQPALADALKGTKATKVDLLPPGTTDPHIWLSPALWTKAIAVIGKALGRSTKTYSASLTRLDNDYRRGLRHCARHTIVTNHAAFGHLAKTYGLEQLAISGIAPEAEPSPSRLASLADTVRREHVTTVFTETLVSPKVARTLAQEAGVKTRVLDPIEGLSSAQLARDASYASEMRRNLSAIRDALGCR